MLNLKDGTLWQWDIGRKMIITLEEGSTIDKVQFYNGIGDNAYPATSIEVVNGEILAGIPNSLLCYANNLTVYLMTTDEDGVKTQEQITLVVNKRAKPEDYIFTDDEFHTYKAYDERLQYLEKNIVLPDRLKESTDTEVKELVPEWARETKPDATLSESGKAADAGKVGNEIASLKAKDNSLAQEIAVERARINNITKAEESGLSTDAERELADVRVGGDGTVYDNAGDAVRSIYDQTVGTATQLYDYTAIEAGFHSYYNNELIISDVDKWYHILIPCVAEEVLYLNYYSTNLTIVFLDVDKKYVAQISMRGSKFIVPNLERIKYVSIPVYWSRIYSVFIAKEPIRPSARFVNFGKTVEIGSVIYETGFASKLKANCNLDENITLSNNHNDGVQLTLPDIVEDTLYWKNTSLNTASADIILGGGFISIGENDTKIYVVGTSLGYILALDKNSGSYSEVLPITIPSLKHKKVHIFIESGYVVVQDYFTNEIYGKEYIESILRKCNRISLGFVSLHGSSTYSNMAIGKVFDSTEFIPYLPIVDTEELESVSSDLDQCIGKEYDSVLNTEDPDVITDGYIFNYDENGNPDIQGQGTWCESGYIPCQYGDCFTNPTRTAAMYINCMLYDENKNFIGRTSYSVEPYIQIKNALARYIRFPFRPGDYTSYIYKTKFYTKKFVPYGQKVIIRDPSAFDDLENRMTRLETQSPTLSHWQGKKWYAYGTSITSIAQGKYVPYVEQLSGLVAINKGIPGGGITNLGGYAKGQVKSAIMNTTDGKLEADLITLEVGANEGGELGTKYDIGDDTFCGCLNQCLRYLQANTNAQIVVMYSVQSITSEPSSESQYYDREEKVREVCNINNVYYLGDSSGLGYARISKDTTYTIDNIHQSDLGGYNLAQFIWSKLKDIPLWYSTLPT